MFANKTNSVYGDLLKDPTVRLWFENNDRGSHQTANGYLKLLGRYCAIYKTTPPEFIEKARSDGYSLLLHLIQTMETEGKSGGYIRGTITALKSWLAFNEIIISRKLKIRDARLTPTLINEGIPSKGEFAQVLRSASKRVRVIMLLMAHSGIRYTSMGNGNDGLRIKDIPDLTIENNQIIIKQMPAMIIVRANLSKNHRQYVTFLSDEGCIFLREYLEARLRKGEMLTPESPIVLSGYNLRHYIFTDSHIFRFGVHRVIHAAGFKWRPYIFRHYFATRLQVAESFNLLHPDYRDFWMGHKGRVGNAYTLDKGKLAPEQIDAMREKYKAAQDYLQTMVDPIKKSGSGGSAAEREEQQLNRQLAAKQFGLPGKKIQKMVTLKEAKKYLDDGWVFVTKLDENNLIIEKEE